MTPKYRADDFKGPGQPLIIKDMVKPTYGDISPRSVSFYVAAMLEQAEPSKFAQMFPPKPLTRAERFKCRMAEYRDRLYLAWAALRGDQLYRDYP
jgi:hypothetical protein